MDFLAMIVGYAVLCGALLVVIISAVDVSIGNPAYMITVFGFGPCVIDIERNPVLYENMIKVGYRLKRFGRFAVGFSFPKWVNRLFLRRT